MARSGERNARSPLRAFFFWPSGMAMAAPPA